MTKKFLVFVMCIVIVSSFTCSAFANVSITGNFKDGKVGDRYSGYTNSGNVVVNGRASYSFFKVSLVDGELPPGLSLTILNGITIRVYFEGIATRAGTYNFTIMAEDVVDDAGSATKSFSMTITDNPNITDPTINGTFPSGNPSTPYSNYISAADGTAPYTWSYTGNLPPGLQLRGNDTDTTGNRLTLSGTPTTIGSYTFDVTVRDFYEHTAQKSFTVQIGSSESLSITTPTQLFSGTVGSSFNEAFTSNNSSTRWSITDGTLPNGLSLNSTTGIISGTPTSAGTYTFTLIASANNQTAQRSITITIAGSQSSLEIEYSFTNATVEVPYSDYVIVTGGSSYSWRVTDGRLPDGLSLDPVDDRLYIRGTPTVAGDYDFSLTVRDSLGNSQTKAFSVSVADAMAIVGTLSNGTVNTPYSSSLNVTGGRAPYSWEVREGSLPPGLSLTSSDNTATISGTPTVAGTYRFDIAASMTQPYYDGNSTSLTHTRTTTFTVTIQDRGISTFSILTNTLSNTIVGLSYSSELRASIPEVAWSITDGSLPPGLTLSGMGVISGTATTPGTYTFTASASNGSETVSRTYAITVGVGGGNDNSTLTITTMRLSDGTVSTPYNQQLTANITEGTTWRVTNGSLPAGFTLSDTGLLYGTPGAAGTTTIEITATNRTITASSYFVIVINPVGSLEITSNAEIRSTANEEVIYNFTANISGVKWSIEGAYPAGILVNPDTGALRGTPTVAGTYLFTATAYGNGQSASKYIMMIISAGTNPNPPDPTHVSDGGGDGGGGGGGCNSGFGLLGLMLLLLRRKA